MARIRRDWRRRHDDNYDVFRFGSAAARSGWWKRFAIGAGALEARRLSRLVSILRHANDLQWLYSRLADDRSRDWLVSLMAFRALGNRRVKLDTNTPGFWRHIQTIGSDLTTARDVGETQDGRKLDDFDLQSIGFPIRLRGKQGNVLYPFMLQQYKLASGDHSIGARPGDVVIDAGGCYGETALYFANEVGSKGAVYCYEFDQKNLEVYQHNVLANPELGARVTLVEKALWSEAGRDVSIRMDGAATRVTQATQGASCSVPTDTVDALVDRNHVPRVDFIKMDIEGAELHALKGAHDTIVRDRPTLAICLYHRLQDFWEIPRYIDALGCDYRFWIGHFTIHSEETVLFAEARPG